VGINFSDVLQNNSECRDVFIQNNLEILKVQYLKTSNNLKLILKSKNTIDKSSENKIITAVKQMLNLDLDVNIVFYKDISDTTLEEINSKYWLELVSYASSNIPAGKECLINSKRSVESNLLKVTYGNKFMFSFLKNKNIELVIKNSINDLFGVTCRVDFDFDSKLEIKNTYNEPFVLNEAVSIDKSIKREKIVEKEITSSVDGVITGRKIDGMPLELISVNEPLKEVTVCGDIFKREIIDTKKGRKIFIFYLTDYTSSITIKLFPKQKDVEKIIEEVKEGSMYKIRGEIVNDSYENELVMMARDIVKTRCIEKMDIAEEKRVELHLHTNMSAMDGMTPAKELVSTAAKWGHKAIAITDHGVVQAYPEAMEAAKKNKIKIIYGIEAYLVDDGSSIVTMPRDKTLEDTFVIFDIETTGLSCSNNKIIEIGAVKIEQGKVVDNFSKFIDPEISIPYRIVELTGITDEMTKGAEKIDTVLKEFISFIGDSIVVAHNANFDVSFIKKNCSDLGLEFSNGVMDTIPLAKYVLPELKRYKLDSIAKYLKINMGSHHRAIDDARTTTTILIHCFNILKERGLCTLSEINSEYLKNQDYKKLNYYHVILLAKNQTGLKNLYKLVSFSNLDYFYKKPRMPKSLIEEYREGLIVGSGCEAGQIYKEILSGKTDEELKPTIDFYDYLEIQPLANNMFLVKKEEVSGIEELKEINRRICALGDKNNLPVAATCDVHFLKPRDEVYRKILMYGQKFSDAEDQPPLYLRTTDEMLKEFEYLGESKANEVVIHNTNVIADMIGEVKPIPDETYTPKIEGAEEEIKEMVLNKVHSIYGNNIPEIIEKRMNKELNSIINNGYAVLYLIAQKLVAKSYSDGYLVGSRGSVGSSFVATMSDITEVNGLPPHYVCPKCKNSEFITDGSVSSGADLPDKKCTVCGAKYNKDGHDIPFETFLGFEGDKEPDIDLNFSGEYQAVVHKYTEVLFGKGHIFKAGTIGTVAEKTAYGFVKKYVDEKNLSLPKAEIERLSKGCTGVKRTTGQHPGGIMVVPSDNEIFNFTPIQHPADADDTDIITTHFDYHSISGRLLKLDILGHDDPTVLKMLQDLTGIDPKTIPLADEKVLSLFTSPNALGVTREELKSEVGTFGLPEFGTKFVRQMLVDTKPKTFSDLVRISGLSHGTDVWVNNAQYYIKEGYTTLSECISTRDDIMIYLIYKGLPPKTAFSIMEKVRKGKGLSQEHEEIMLECKVPGWYIESCKKIKYMFPKGHAVAYVMMAVRIAYFKVYYPKEYYTTYFTVRADDFDAEILIQGEEALAKKLEELNSQGNMLTQKDKGLITILEISIEMYKRNIIFLRVDLYKSHSVKFLIEEDGIRLPINSLQGVGINAANSIVSARENGEFISREDLRLRAKVSKTVIETLDKHLCLRGLPESNQLSLFNM
jgi:DNA polymerase-3 subunit alpha (Gram-positive type)